MNKELEITKEKLYTLEQAWGNISASGPFHVVLVFSPSLKNQFSSHSLLSLPGGEHTKDKADKALANNEMVSVARRMTTLELKELNERQRAEHAHKMYEQMRNSLRQVEERNTELESKFAEVPAQRKQQQFFSVTHSMCPLEQH